MSTEEFLLLCLGIISGRVQPAAIYSEQAWNKLGFNPYEFKYSCFPPVDDVKLAAEQAILSQLVR